jgi:methyl-accepting chemotaxis protein
MTRAHEIGIAADAKAFDQGFRDGVIKPLEDAEDALQKLDDAVGGAGSASDRAADQVDSFADKLAQAARKAGKSDDDIRDALKQMGVQADDARRAVDKLGDESKKTGDKVEDAGRDGERAVDKLDDALKDAQRSSKKLGDAGDDAGDQVRRGMKRAEEGVDDFKQEAQQSARETAASFDGSFESIADLAQEVAANAFAGFGPAGAAAGIAVAAGLGVAVDQFNKIQEASDNALQSAFDFAYGIGAAFDAADKVAAVASWTSDQEKFKQVLDLTSASGWEQVDVIDALVEGGPKLDKLTQAYADNGAASGLTIGRLQELDAVLPSIKQGLESGASAADAQAEYLYKLAQEAGEATGEVDALGNKIVSLPGDVEVAVNAETKTATTDIQRVEDKVHQVDGQEAVVHARVAGLDQVRVDLDALTRPRTMTVTAKLNQAFSQNLGWDK